MASTYSDRLKLELMETGANAATWGTNTNTNLEVIDAYTNGYISKSVAGSTNVTLTASVSSPTSEASNKVLELTGTLTGNITVLIPARESNYVVYNNTSGAFTLDIGCDDGASGALGTTVTITQGDHNWVYSDGTNVTLAQLGTNASSLSTGTLPNGRFPATLPVVSGANLTNLNAANVSSGTLNNARLPATIDVTTVKASSDVNVASSVYLYANGVVSATSYTGNGAALTGIIPSGTKMLFQQTAAPTGWTKDTTHNNKALRVVTGTASSGGSNSFTAAFNTNQTVSGTTGTSSVTISGSTAGHTLTKAQLPNVSGSVDILNRGGASASSDIIRNTTGDFSESAGANYGEGWQGEGGSQSRKLTFSFGSGSSHSHSVNITSGSHSHSFSDTFNLNVQYVDLIIATKN